MAAGCLHLASTSSAFREVRLVILLYQQIHPPASHNVQLPRYIIHAEEVAVWAQIHLHNTSDTGQHCANTTHWALLMISATQRHSTLQACVCASRAFKSMKYSTNAMVALYTNMQHCINSYTHCCMTVTCCKMRLLM